MKQEMKEQQTKYNNQIKELFNEQKIDYISIGETYLDRFNKDKEIIKDKFNIETIW